MKLKLEIIALAAFLGYSSLAPDMALGQEIKFGQYGKTYSYEVSPLSFNRKAYSKTLKERTSSWGKYYIWPNGNIDAWGDLLGLRFVYHSNSSLETLLIVNSSDLAYTFHGNFKSIKLPDVANVYGNPILLGFNFYEIPFEDQSFSGESPDKLLLKESLHTSLTNWREWLSIKKIEEIAKSNEE